MSKGVWFTVGNLSSSLWRRVLGVFLLLVLTSSAFAAPFEFSAQDVTGHPHSLTNERGNWVVINIWATWCPPCRKELPELAAFARDHAKDHIKVWGLSVDTDASADELAMFAQEYGVDYPIFKLNPRSLAVFGNIPGIPTTFLINPKGELVARHVGGITAEQLVQMIGNNS
ncbi:TlpA disulfide reductase family protein [Halothiobacillus sp.]|uniref:TlpA family protein disulfide reductase n=1 Tax=Halothiobacillus sp. TaxID=1891311 RepID=UPI002637915C|nr:TlpA disulfide reductase family protein [Halothiobacillus sp.]